jgi:hypothetical protein
MIIVSPRSSFNMSEIGVGSRVRRGPDWPAGFILDLHNRVPGTGTVIKVCEVSGMPWCDVKWDSGFQTSYQKTDLQLSDDVESKVTENAAMQQDIKKLMGNKETSDFMVVCGGEEFPCHRAILYARSTTFRRGVVSSMEEGTAHRWTIDNAEPAAVRDMIEYIYTGEMPAEGVKERAAGLLDLATEYDLPRLGDVCKNSLIGSLSVDSAVRTLVLMDRSGEDK